MASPEFFFSPTMVREKREQRRFVTAETTIASEKHPDRNEDSTFSDAENGLVALSDGAGGHASGDKMSRATIQLVKESAPRMTGNTIDELSQAMDAEINLILKKGEKISRQLTPKGSKEAMATLILAKLIEVNGRYSAVVKGLGDSRAYIKRANGQLEKVELFEDGYLNLLVEMQRFSPEVANLISEATDVNSFSAELLARNFGSVEQITKFFGMGLWDLDANSDDLRKENLLLFQIVTAFKRYFSNEKRGAVTQSVGADRKQMEGGEFVIHTAIVANLRPGDRLFLVSDGVSDNLNTEQIDAAAVGTDFQDQLENLRDTALARSRDQNHMRHKADDITSIGIEVPEAAIVETTPAKSPAPSSSFFGRLRGILTRKSAAALPAEISEAQARALGLAKGSNETKELEKVS
ncbi:MAG: protein phosphatase 2C domain-containing protein [Patescibacteria group bacterium]|jgi:serine/threonine protein phosphatase PrpC